MAKNMSASPWHWPEGLRAGGVPMMLFLQGFSADNVYDGTYEWAGQSVAGSDASRFFSDRFADLTSGASQCSALTLDGLSISFLEFEDTTASASADSESSCPALHFGTGVYDGPYASLREAVDGLGIYMGASARVNAINMGTRDFTPDYLHVWQIKTFWHRQRLSFQRH